MMPPCTPTCAREVTRPSPCTIPDVAHQQVEGHLALRLRPPSGAERPGHAGDRHRTPARAGRTDSRNRPGTTSTTVRERNARAGLASTDGREQIPLRQACNRLTFILPRRSGATCSAQWRNSPPDPGRKSRATAPWNACDVAAGSIPGFRLSAPAPAGNSHEQERARPPPGRGTGMRARRSRLLDVGGHPHPHEVVRTKLVQDPRTGHACSRRPVLDLRQDTYPYARLTCEAERAPRSCVSLFVADGHIPGKRASRTRPPAATSSDEQPRHGRDAETTVSGGHAERREVFCPRTTGRPGPPPRTINGRSSSRSVRAEAGLQPSLDPSAGNSSARRSSSRRSRSA